MPFINVYQHKLFQRKNYFLVFFMLKHIQCRLCQEECVDSYSRYSLLSMKHRIWEIGQRLISHFYGN